ncbi:MAG: sigma-70 family RNA polymerase sigma factor [Firmicutes bacterium]|jgi:RNA polymerase sporulation-specific sigma factor|nr:sigma-70 family RNA polymerase sigma factor [Bacillota bacterium]
MGSLTKEDLTAVVENHGGLVKSVAIRLARAYGEDLEDLIQIGYIGLIKAAQRFEPERGLQFSTYAVPMITGEIRSQLRDQGAIKMSRSLKADISLVRRAESDFIKLHGVSPHLTQLAELTGLDAERVKEAYQAADAMKNFEDYENVNLWTDDEESNIRKIDLTEAISHLEPRERQVIILRYYKDYTQQQVADLLGISQVQVCRIEKRTLKGMAERISG